MTAVGVSSGIFRDIFSTEPMRRIFADENRVQKYLDIEAALARAQARLGIIPQEAAEEICRHCDAKEYDFAKLKSQTERIVTRCCRWCSSSSRCAAMALANGATGAPPPRHHRHRHHPADPRGARPRRSGHRRDRGCAGALAKRYRDTPMAGRSNLQQAVPITSATRPRHGSPPSTATASA